MKARTRQERILRFLRERRNSTVSELSNEFGVSVRTIHRDIGELRERGFLIDGFAGVGGGVRLDPRSMLPAVHFTDDEILALILAVAMLEKSPWTPFQRFAEQAIQRVKDALPKQRVVELRRLLERVFIGSPAGELNTKTLGEVDPNLLGVFERCFLNEQTLRFNYEDRFGNETHRTIEPHGLLVHAPFWYIIAWDCDKEASRIFRMDRIEFPKATETTFVSKSIKRICDDTCPEAKMVPNFFK